MSALAKAAAAKADDKTISRFWKSGFMIRAPRNFRENHRVL